MRVLVATKETKGAIRTFRKHLKDVAVEDSKLEWGFPNGERADYPTYTLNSCYGNVQVGLPDAWATRIPHLFRFVKEQGSPSPDVEINIPPELDRKVSGVYVQSEKELWLCSRGAFTAFRGRIPQNLAHAHFKKWLREVDDGSKTANVIPVVSMDSPTFVDDIATFVRAVVELKEKYKQRQSSVPEDLSGDNATWSRGKEFEGTKSSKRTQAEIEYEYLHGPVCNRLENHLKKILSRGRLEFGKNSHVDGAIVYRLSSRATCLFEVKTASLPSSQIYSAVGQLMYYRHRYGTAGSHLFVVLPSGSRSQPTESFLTDLGITLVYESSGDFKVSSGTTLKTHLESKNAV